MNKLFMIIGAVCLFTLTALVDDMLVGTSYSKNKEDEMLAWNYKYCASMQNGKLTVMKEGKALAADATLENGTMVPVSKAILTQAAASDQGQSIRRLSTRSTGISRASPESD